MKIKPEICPCGSKKHYSNCCEVFHNGINRGTKPETPEKLMSSRYSAYVVGDIDYIAKTNDPETGQDFDHQAALKWSKNSEWLGLEVIAASGNEVEFKARFRMNGKEEVHHEVSLFRFDTKSNQWYYRDGNVIREPEKRETPKMGRNDHCSCGSGKKFKKCCGS